jgi:iron(III) transport system substrate-binding protein
MRKAPAFVAALSLFSLASMASAADELVVYSARIDELIKPVFDAYTARTGVTIKFITDKEAPLLARLQAEGENTPADMLITVDAGNLWQAEQQGVLKPLQSATIEANIPAQYRAPSGAWTGLSLRARTIFYSTERVDPQELSTYEALADAQWAGRLCLRSSKKVYNQSLTASLIEVHGVPKTEQIVKGWISNLATEVFADDTALLQAIAAGQCDVGIANTYYFGRLAKQQPDIKVKPFWPNQQDRGVHVNISGAGVTRHAPNAAEAEKFLEWLTGSEAQGLFASLNQEYPANPAIKPDAEVAAWGEFKADKLALEVAGKRQAEATMLMDRAGWN